MTAVRLDERLAAAGLDPSEIPVKSRLFDKVFNRLRAMGARRITSAWWVPGRLEVFGTHTDYAGGRTLVAAVPRGFAVAVSPRRDSVVRVADALRSDDVAIELGRHASQVTGWRRYVRTVVERMAANFPGAPMAADIVFASDLPRASGMSSSSALMVSVATAVAHAGALRDRPEWRSNLAAGRLAEAAYYACIENGHTFGSLAGDAGVGTHGGSEDHAAILMGQPRTVSGFSFVPMRALGTAPVGAEWAFVIASSGIHAGKAGAVRDRYNRLSEGTSVLVSLWNRANPPARSLGEALSGGPSAIERLERLIRQSNEGRWTPDGLAARLRHFVQEDARIPEALRVFESGDEDALGGLGAASQADAEQLLGNQVPETAALARLALDHGAIASRSFGAGFGGSVWAVAHAGEAVPFMERWLAAYRKECPAAQNSVVFAATPGPSLTALTG